MQAQTSQNPFQDQRFNQMFSDMFTKPEPKKAAPSKFVFEVASCGTIRIVEKN